MKAGQRNSALLRWHRHIGLVAAALVVVLALSGVALNHSDVLELDQRAVTTPLLLEWYDINTGGRWLSAERILLDVHSGRILGRYGPWLMDGAAILLLILAATGLIGWFRGRGGNGANDA